MPGLRAVWGIQGRPDALPGRPVGVQHGATAWIGVSCGLQLTLIEVAGEDQYAVEELRLGPGAAGDGRSSPGMRSSSHSVTGVRYRGRPA